MCLIPGLSRWLACFGMRRSRMPLIHQTSMVHALFLITAARLVGQSPQTLPEMVVLAERGGGEGAALAEWSRDDVMKAAPRTIDELLAREPSFSLYRRQSAMFGNPTSAGVSLRNTGATAASRTPVRSSSRR